jgi:hypothetical protein
MPTIGSNELVNTLTQRVETALREADSNQDGAVDESERAMLPSDVRGLADSTADAYLSGGPMSINAYVNGYRNFATEGVTNADTNSSGHLTDAEQQNLSTPLYQSMLAIRAGQEVIPETTTAPTTSLDALYQQLGQGGWTDDTIMQYINAAQQGGELQARVSEIVNAVMSPEVPAGADAGDKFLEALAWYIDKTVLGSGDGQMSRAEIQAAVQHYTQEYLNNALNPDAADTRRQSWKMIQKLRILEKEIDGAGASAYPYDASRLSRVNTNNAWNQAHTVESFADFQENVINASYEKPILVKYGLTYCAHCLLLEHLDSVKAVADKYGSNIDVQKVWWNPNDATYAEPNAIASSQGVSSSPHFVVYKDGQPVSQGYAFPDEEGNGVEELLNHIV